MNDHCAVRSCRRVTPRPRRAIPRPPDRGPGAPPGGFFRPRWPVEAVRATCPSRRPGRDPRRGPAERARCGEARSGVSALRWSPRPPRRGSGRVGTRSSSDRTSGFVVGFRVPPTTPDSHRVRTHPDRCDAPWSGSSRPQQTPTRGGFRSSSVLCARTREGAPRPYGSRRHPGAGPGPVRTGPGTRGPTTVRRDDMGASGRFEGLVGSGERAPRASHPAESGRNRRSDSLRHPHCRRPTRPRRTLRPRRSDSPGARRVAKRATVRPDPPERRTGGHCRRPAACPDSGPPSPS